MLFRKMDGLSDDYESRRNVKKSEIMPKNSLLIITITIIFSTLRGLLQSHDIAPTSVFYFLGGIMNLIGMNRYWNCLLNSVRLYKLSSYQFLTWSIPVIRCYAFTQH